jgi:putative methyltransferase (TIGR04325 family)
MKRALSIDRLLPPVLADAIRHALGRTMYFTAADGSWDDAVSRSSGYDAASIIDRVASAARAVKAGHAAFERDSVLFQERVLPFQLAAPLVRHALEHNGVLDVVDFGGSLGSTFHQLRWYLPPLRALRWQVIEQEAFVHIGRTEFTTQELSFHTGLDQLPAASGPRVVLLSSVLQYLRSPHEVLDSLSKIGASLMIIDRTPFAELEHDRLCIQHVPATIYPASYPAWVFSTPRFEERLASRWSTLLAFVSAEGSFVARRGPRFRFEGRVLTASPACVR